MTAGEQVSDNGQEGGHDVALQFRGVVTVRDKPEDDPEDAAYHAKREIENEIRNAVRSVEPSANGACVVEVVDVTAIPPDRGTDTDSQEPIDIGEP